MNAPERLAHLVDFWQTLTPERVAQLEAYYTEDASFQDPFNTVQGIAAITHIFDEMFLRLVGPRFEIRETVASGDAAFLVWDFTFGIRALKPAHQRLIHGSSHIRFAPDGRVCYHRDYWDAAGELYAQLPVLGGLMRGLARWFA